MYHEVLPDEVNLPAWTVVKESVFRWQMSYLQKNFDIVSIDEALKRINQKNLNIKRPFAVITFDDGYRGNFDIVLPIMELMGLPFTIYVATKAIVEENLYWYDQIINLIYSKKNVGLNIDVDGKLKIFKIPKTTSTIRRWRHIQYLLTQLKQRCPEDRDKLVCAILEKFSLDENSGEKTCLKMLSSNQLYQLSMSDCVTIGSHTHGHELLDQLKPVEIKNTIQTANFYIKKITGNSPKHFAYPNGNLSKEVINNINMLGFETAMATLGGTWSAYSNLLAIPRIGIGGFDTNSQFKAKIAGYL
ncbi:MAG: polysaccharide deacetylase family protein [Candidatus Competibacteraceae bacterium]|nr:polysaccharide deacetylase family protein [Candidatus Competibacteraceae bacterium]